MPRLAKFIEPPQTPMVFNHGQMGQEVAQATEQAVEEKLGRFWLLLNQSLNQAYDQQIDATETNRQAITELLELVKAQPDAFLQAVAAVFEKTTKLEDEVGEIKAELAAVYKIVDKPKVFEHIVERVNEHIPNSPIKKIVSKQIESEDAKHDG